MCAVAAIRLDLVVEQCLELAGVRCPVRVAEVDAAAQRVLGEVAEASVVAAVVGASWDLGALWVIVIARSGSGLGSRVFVGGGGLSDPAAGVPSAGPTRTLNFAEGLAWHVGLAVAVGMVVGDLDLELIQTQMAQKPKLWAEVHARA